MNVLIRPQFGIQPDFSTEIVTLSLLYNLCFFLIVMFHCLLSELKKKNFRYGEPNVSIELLFIQKWYEVRLSIGSEATSALVNNMFAQTTQNMSCFI